MLVDLRHWLRSNVFARNCKTRRRFTRCAGAIAAASALIAGQADGAAITFGSPNLGTASADVNTGGTLVEAINLVSDDSLVDGTVSVNGVAFVDTNLFGNGYAVTGLVSTGDADLDDLVGTVGYGGPPTVTLSGLDVGQLYELQIFIGDGRDLAIGRTLTVGDGDGDTSNDVSYVYSDGGSSIQATSITGTFVADAATQEFVAVLGNGGSGTELAAYQLRAVPEPATLSLLAMAGLGAFSIYRRQNA